MYLSLHFFFFLPKSLFSLLRIFIHALWAIDIAYNKIEFFTPKWSRGEYIGGKHLNINTFFYFNVEKEQIVMYKEQRRGNKWSGLE